VVCKADWAQAYPQSVHRLREEAAGWEKTAWTLELKGI
jgi:hypothetical protein